MNSEQYKLCVNSSLYIDARLLCKQAVINPNKLMKKLSKHLCVEYSACAMLLSSSFNVSIKQR